jgi:hypothetical protein
MQTIGSGSECTVFKTEKGILKCYNSKSDAQQACELQQKLSYFDLAPEVYTNARRHKVDDATLWGYYSEEAELLPECECEGDIKCYSCEQTEDAREEVIVAIEYWTGLEYVDFHLGNFGFVIRDGRRAMVCIDTGVKGFIDTIEQEA